MSQTEAEEIDKRLENLNREHVGYELNKKLFLGARAGGRLVGGLLGYTTLYRIMYIETLYIDEEYRRKGLGAALLKKAEERARDMGVDIIRLDTFDWQGYEFYKACGYTEVGNYSVPADGFAEYFFIKRLRD